MEISLENIKRVQEDNIWSFGNQILYDMCEKTPRHINEDEIVGKVWLIGRSYAAAIERTTNSTNKGDNFYRYEVAKKIEAIGAELDSKITKLRDHATVKQGLLSEILETHYFLTDVFKKISGKDNRSLASKYLHFHVPNIFYIYDSRASVGVTRLKTLDSKLKKQLLQQNCDNSYVDFVSKIYPLNVKIYEEHGIWLTPRQMDVLLLEVSCR